MEDSGKSIISVPPAWEGVAIGCLFLVITVVGDRLGHNEVSGIAGAFIVATLASIRLFWPLWQKFWFWIAMVALAIMQTIVVINFPWNTDDFGGRSYAFFTFLDLVAILSIVTLLHKLVTLINKFRGHNT